MGVKEVGIACRGNKCRRLYDRGSGQAPFFRRYIGLLTDLWLTTYAADSWFPVAAPEELVRGEIDVLTRLIIPHTHAMRSETRRGFIHKA